MKAWEGFTPGPWQRQIDTRDFIQRNYTAYAGDDSFLVGPTDRTQALWEKVFTLFKAEQAKGAPLAIDTQTPSSILAYGPGYVDKELELITGLQTDEPGKRSFYPYGGWKMVVDAFKAYGVEPAPELGEIFTLHRKTHNQGVFDAYTPEMKLARKTGIITGLPDAYGRGRIIGDYRRVALYGTDRLVAGKELELTWTEPDAMDEATIRQREELAEQIRALGELKAMGARYGLELGRPAENAREAFQWLYMGYLAAIKEQNGAAMSIGRISTFLDIYLERDLALGLISEAEAQELVDQLIIKLRQVTFLRTPDYNELFSGDPTWVTESIGGMGLDGRPLVTKSSFRFLHTLYNLGPAPEPNLTVLWSPSLPDGFKRFCAKVSIDTSSIQYENDDVMRPFWGDDYGIACCVSAMRIGKQMQFFGARANLAKCMLYAINGGVDEKLGVQVGPSIGVVTDDVLDYADVRRRFSLMMDWLARLYVNTLNIIHYMHDKYFYERIEFALHDREIHRTLACGIAGLSVVADSLSAIKYAKVKPVRNTEGIIIDYEVEGEYPTFGNNDERVDSIAREIVEEFMHRLKKHKAYRNAEITMSVLTITSNVVYGKKTGNTPDGRRAGEPFAPGANPMHGRDTRGALASCCSVSKLPYTHAQDGISYTFSIVPGALGRTRNDQLSNLVGLLDGYAVAGGHHINVNALTRETLLDAMEHPEQYPQLTIRVSGYAVNFVKLSREQQLDVINRTFHSCM
ncbi:MAG TPA: formate C-acetyltransferase [Symbiobacteriaceae bacterium]|nr:formate C-acetyltransferase [Symbiobacteriaceae bacterium]